MSIRSLLLAATAATLTLAVAAEAEPFRLIVTELEPPLVPNSVVDVAIAGGYFERAGVDVELVRVQQTPMALAALQSGEGEMANVATEAALQLITQGAKDLRAVTSPNKSLPYIIAGKEGMTLAGLAGQSFGIGRIGSLDHGLSVKVLETAGVDPAGLEMVALGQPSVRAQALAAGQIAATTISIGSYLALPGHENLPILVDLDTYYQAAPAVTKVNVVRTETLATRGAEVEAVIEGLTLAARDMAASPEAWANAMATLRSDVDPATLATLGEAFQGSWSVNGGLEKDELAYTQDWIWQGEDFKALPPLSLGDWVDFGPVDHVLARIGVDEDTKTDVLSR